MGETYISSVMDTLLAQAFYNSALIAVLDQVIVGNTSGSGDIEENSNLFPLRVPTTFVGRTFAELFHFLCERKHIIAIGLYRYDCREVTTKPYIVTNPPVDLVLTDRDMVFVLAKAMIDYEISNKWGSPLEDDATDEKTLLKNVVAMRKIQKRVDVADPAAGDNEVNDYLDKLNVENKRRKELKENAAIVKKLKSKCDRIQRKVEELGEKIKSRPDMLAKTVKDVMMSVSLKNPKKTPITKSNIPRDSDSSSVDKDSDSS